MNFKINNIFYTVILGVVSFSINFFYASLGVLPIDTFAFFDSGYRIMNGDIPFEDFWTISGPLIDLIQSLYFFIFGLNWNSYVLNGSVINVLFCLITYFFLQEFGLNQKYSFFYSLCIAFLANPSMGTPFPDHYSTFFSFFAVISFLYGIKYNKNIYWLLTPVLFFFAFFCKQTPSAYLIIFFLINYTLYSVIKKDFKFIFPVLLGSFFSISVLVLYFIINKIDINSFITQYFLYPRTIGSTRLNEWDLSFNKAISTLKFIYFILVPLIFIFVKNLIFSKNYKTKNNFFINLNIISFSLILIFHQWLTLNFIFIFFLIPLLCAVLHINIGHVIKHKKFVTILLLSFCLLATTKYHFRFNQERKMLDLENINLSNYYKAGNFASQLKGLKWITREYSTNPNKEIEKLVIIKEILKNEKKEIMFLSTYQFFSIILDKSLHSPNRWYGGEVAHPPKKNPFYDDYLSFIYKQIKKNRIKLIFVDVNLGNYHLELFEEILKKFPPSCSNLTVIQDVLIRYDISSCY